MKARRQEIPTRYLPLLAVQCSLLQPLSAPKSRRLKLNNKRIAAIRIQCFRTFSAPTVRSKDG